MIAIDISGFEISSGVLALGSFTGLTYGLLAAGLVLVYRSSRFINFAHSAIGLFGAAFTSLAVHQYGVPYWLAMVFGLLVGAAVGAATEVVIVKPLSRAPKVLPMVATLGMSTFLIVSALAINPDGMSGLAFPQPSHMPTGSIGALQVTPAYAAQAILSPLVLLALGVFLWRSKIGLAIRGAASNPDAAATSGISPRAMAVLSWAIAGGIAAFAATLILPTRGVVTPETLGPELLLRGLAAAAIARFSSFGVAVGTAVAIGVVEQVFATNPDASGWIEVAILLAVVASLLIDRRPSRRPVEPWTELGTSQQLPIELRRNPLVRAVSVGLLVVVGCAALMVPFMASGSQALSATVVIGLAIVGVSVGVVTGLGGQLSLAQFGFGAIAAAVSVKVADSAGLVVGVFIGASVAAVVAMVLALPALRVRGPQLGVATLSFSLVTSAFLLNKDFLLGSRAVPDRPSITILGIRLDESRGYYWVALIALVVVLLIAHRVRATAFARTLVAVRDNEDAARAMAVSGTKVKLQAALVGGFIAGIGGAIYGHGLTSLSSANFPASASIDAITVTVIGGLNSLAGPVLGALYLKGIPEFFHIPVEALAGLSGAWLILLVYQYGGLAGLLAPVRLKFAAALARIAPTPQPGDREHEALALAADIEFPDRSAERGDPLLEVRGLTRRFGSLVAVDNVSFTVTSGEMVGLIGPNGAGKTTLFELISGFTRASEGTVIFRGNDVTRLGARPRAELGVARSFQSAELFATLSVVETVMVAMERTLPLSAREFVASGGIEARRRSAALALLDQFDLGAYADATVATLPTGVRRSIELVCAVASKPRLMLLDEPSAGIAQADTEELGRTLRALHERTGVTMIVIEHDLPLLASICDRLLAMEVGALIADGPPAAVQADPAVIAAYVGTSDIAVNRSAGA